MNKYVPVIKDEEKQALIPNEWRSTIESIVEAFVEKDYKIERDLENVCSVSEEDATHFENNISSYPYALSKLNSATWNSSVCQWMSGHWDVLVDLTTIEEKVSDLSLALKISESRDEYTFEIISIHVP